jgi:hypothetical protein
MKIYLFLISALLIAFITGCEKELSVSPEEEYATKNGVIIESNPAGAKIYVNGKNTGQFTPDTLFWLEPGNFLLTLKKELFKDSSLIVKVVEEDTIRIFLDYTTNKTMLGKLYIDSNPRGAQIFLNDSALNKITPFTTEGLTPGYYKVRLRVAGYWDEEKITPVRSVVTTYFDAQMIDTLVWANFNTDRSDIPSNFLSSVAIEKGYIKWIGSLDAGLIRFDDKTWTVYDMHNSILPDNQVNSVAVDEFDNLWVCTDFGVVKKNGDNWTLYNTQNSGLPDNRVTSVSFNGVNTCFGTVNNGIVIFDGSNWINYTKDNSPLPSNLVNDVLYHDINLWACTNNGLAKITNDTTWRIINSSNSSNIVGGGGPGSTPRTTGFPNNNCKTITVDRLNKPWLGFGAQGGVDGGSSVLRIANIWRTYYQKPSGDVFSIAVDMNNVKWFGSSENGLSKFEEAVWTHYRMSNSKIKSDRIYSVIIDQNGHKWMASYGAGLIKYKGN